MERSCYFNAEISKNSWKKLDVFNDQSLPEKVKNDVKSIKQILYIRRLDLKYIYVNFNQNSIIMWTEISWRYFFNCQCICCCCRCVETILSDI